MITTNEWLNNYLKGERIKKEHFDELKTVIGEVGKHEKIIDWFVRLQKTEISGWRPKQVTQKIARTLKTENIVLYALFCPSYVKGKGQSGIRTDDVGETTIAGIKNLYDVWKYSQGLTTSPPIAIYFNIAFEQADKVSSEQVEANIVNLKKRLPKDMAFRRISQLGKIKRGHIPKKTLDRIIERGKKFYERFGWSSEQIKERSKEIAEVESGVGGLLKEFLPNGIMVYTPTMLERAEVYSGMEYETDPLPIIFPKKGL